MLGEGIPWIILLPLALIALVIGINVGRKEQKKILSSSQIKSDESINN